MRWRGLGPRHARRAMERAERLRHRDMLAQFETLCSDDDYESNDGGEDGEAHEQLRPPSTPPVHGGQAASAASAGASSTAAVTGSEEGELESSASPRHARTLSIAQLSTTSNAPSAPQALLA